MRFLDRVPRTGCGGDASIRGNLPQPQDAVALFRGLLLAELHS